MPAENTALRRSIDKWLLQEDLAPTIVAEIDDTALSKVFAEAGFGIVCAPLAIRKEIERQYGLRLLLTLPDAVERFYAITVERRIRHPAIVAISTAAKETLFSGDQ